MIYIVSQVLFVLIPWCFLSLKKGTNKIIFVASVVGLVEIIKMALVGLLGAIFYFLEFIAPKAFPNGIPAYLDSAFMVLEWCRESWLVITLGVALISFFICQWWLYSKSGLFQQK